MKLNDLSHLVYDEETLAAMRNQAKENMSKSIEKEEEIVSEITPVDIKEQENISNDESKEIQKEQEPQENKEEKSVTIEDKIRHEELTPLEEKPSEETKEEEQQQQPKEAEVEEQQPKETAITDSKEEEIKEEPKKEEEIKENDNKDTEKNEENETPVLLPPSQNDQETQKVLSKEKSSLGAYLFFFFSAFIIISLIIIVEKNNKGFEHDKDYYNIRLTDDEADSYNFVDQDAYNRKLSVSKNYGSDIDYSLMADEETTIYQ